MRYHGRRLLRCIARGLLHIARGLFGMSAIDRMLLVSGKYTTSVLKAFGARVGPRSRIDSPLIVHSPSGGYGNLRIGADCHIGKDVFFDLSDAIVVDEMATVSMRATIITHMDVGRSPLGCSGYEATRNPVCLQRGAYVGAAATILQGVTIGECAVVAAGAVATSDVPAFTVAAGVPARVVKRPTSRAEAAMQK